MGGLVLKAGEAPLPQGGVGVCVGSSLGPFHRREMRPHGYEGLNPSHGVAHLAHPKGGSRRGLSWGHVENSTALLTFIHSLSKQQMPTVLATVQGGPSGLAFSRQTGHTEQLSHPLVFSSTED